MSLQDYFVDIFEGAGPSSGPKYDELESVWRKFIDEEGDV